jgi:general secretion pathway protein M
MNQVWAFLNKYNRREQLLILGLAAFLAVFILWAAIISPLYKKRDLLLHQNTATSESLGQVQMMAAQIQQLQNQGAQAQSGENISGIIDTSLRNNGLKMDGFQPGPEGDVRVRLEMARYDSLMQWLYELESRHGISILEISLAETRDVGVVTVNLRLQKI